MLSFILLSLGLLLLYGAVNIYVTRRLHRWLSALCRVRYWLFCVIYALPASSLWLYFVFQFLPEGLGAAIPVWLRSAVIWVGSVWMGIFLYLLLWLLVLDLALALLRLCRRFSKKARQRVRFWGTSAVLTAVALLVVWGTAHAANIQTVSYEITLDKAVEEPLNVVLISDLHLGAAGSERNLEKVVAAVNTLEPDVVCIAGDLFNDDLNTLYDPARIVTLLQSIQTRYGVYACLGNHDGVNRFDDMLRLLEESNVILLNDEYRIVADRFVIVGRLDGHVIGDFDGLERKELAELLVPVTDLPVIVMDHNPKNLKEYGEGVDLVLSGHTHKGQLFPASLITYLMYDVHYGYYRANENSPHAVVTSGAGYWGMPMRIGTDCEIVQITVREK